MMRSTTIIAPLPTKKTGTVRSARRAAGLVKSGGIAMLVIGLGTAYLLVSAIIASVRLCVNTFRSLVGR